MGGEHNPEIPLERTGPGDNAADSSDGVRDESRRDPAGNRGPRVPVVPPFPRLPHDIARRPVIYSPRYRIAIVHIQPRRGP
jgi:hypothetical protein